MRKAPQPDGDSDFTWPQSIIDFFLTYAPGVQANVFLRPDGGLAFYDDAVLDEDFIWIATGYPSGRPRRRCPVVWRFG